MLLMMDISHNSVVGIRSVFVVTYDEIFLPNFLRQPAIDAFALDMMRLFNKLPKARTSSWFSTRVATEPSSSLQPLIYNTFQGYLRRYAALESL